MTWSPDLIQIFEDMKNCITSLPILAHFDPTKPVFLKIDLSEKGKVWILMQPADEKKKKNQQRSLLQLMNAIFIWRKTEQDYSQSPMDCVRAKTRRINFTLLWENPQLVTGVSVKIDINYGGRTSIGCAPVKQCRNLWNIMGVSRWYKYGIKNYTDIISQQYIKVRRWWGMSMHSLDGSENFLCIPMCSKDITR